MIVLLQLPNIRDVLILGFSAYALIVVSWLVSLLLSYVWFLSSQPEMLNTIIHECRCWYKDISFFFTLCFEGMVFTVIHFIQLKSWRRMLIRHSKRRLLLIDFINIQVLWKVVISLPSIPEKKQEIKKDHYFVTFNRISLW